VKGLCHTLNAAGERECSPPVDIPRVRPPKCNSKMMQGRVQARLRAFLAGAFSPMMFHVSDQQLMVSCANIMLSLEDISNNFGSFL
jgi:hypothetical protein